MNNRTKQIIVVVAVFVIALASLGTVIGLLATTGRLEEYSNGFYFSLQGSRATITAYDGDDTDVVIPDRIRGNRVVAVGAKAFANKAASIKTVTVKSTYSSFALSEEAFKDMSALEQVVLPSGLKEISESAFSGCRTLIRVIMPDGVSVIGSKAFYGCTSLKFAYNTQDYVTEGEGAVSKDVFYMPSGLLEIGDSAFEGCTALLGARFGKSLENIGERAFCDATAFTELTVEDDCELATIGNSAFQNTKLRSNSSYALNFPHLVTIGDSAFEGVTSNFTQFTVPASVTKIGAQAFKGITSLTTVNFAEQSKLETLGEGVFQNCTYLSSIELPEVLKEIPAKAFMGCTRLLYNNTFTIGKNVEKIGDGAFAIYSDNATYSRYALLVDPDNENFAILELQEFKKTGYTSKYQHGLLVNNDSENIVVYAYYGSFDGNSYNINDKGEEKTGLDKTAFRFYDKDGGLIQEITEIKGYAFAGVAFDLIRLPKTVTALGEYVFFNSKVRDVYIESIGWTWQDTTFKLKEDSTSEDDYITVLILESTSSPGNIGAISEFLTQLSADGIESGRANWN